MKEFSFVVENTEDNCEKFLLHTIGLSPRSQIKKYFQNNQIRIDGKIAKRNSPVQIGQNVSLPNAGLNIKGNIKIVPQLNSNIKTIVENENWIAIDKPAGVACHPHTSDETNTVLNHLSAISPLTCEPFQNEKPLEGGLVHRLDNITSGILLCAKNKDTFNAIKQNWSNPNSYKLYLAVVIGKTPQGGEINLNLEHDPKNKKRMKVVTFGSKTWRCKTSFITISSDNNLSLILIRIHTGVTHQIRASFEAIGNPLANDPIYNKMITTKILPMKLNQYDEKLFLSLKDKFSIEQIKKALSEKEPFLRCISVFIENVMQTPLILTDRF